MMKKSAGWTGSSEFTVDSEVRAAQGDEAALNSFSLVSGAPCGRSGAVGSRCGLVKMGDGESNMLIYDMGGGVFDGSLSIVKSGILEVRATLGDDHWHEKDFDSGAVGRRHAGVQAERVDSWIQLATKGIFFHGANHRDRFFV